MEPTQQKSNGALIGSIIIIVILIIGGIYLFNMKRLEVKQNNTENTQTQNSIDASLSDTDEVSDIEADLNATSDVDNLDQGLE